MPQFFRSTPGSGQEAIAPARWHSGGSRTGAAPQSQGRFAEPAEAAWRHNEAFEQLRARVEFLNSQIEMARATLSDERADLLDGVHGALHALKAGLASVRAAWRGDEPSLLSQASAALAGVSALGPRTQEAPPAEPDPWDAASAEALTRVYEIAALEERRPQPSACRQRVQTPDPEPRPLSIGDPLERQLAGLADQLQQALPRIDPSHWLAPLEVRLRQLEQQIAAALPPGSAGGVGAAPAAGGDLENTRAELVRLDAIEAQLAEVLADLKAARAVPAPGLPAREAMGARSEQLESLIKSYAAGRRQDARTAVAVLRSIHHAIAQIGARLEEAPADLIPLAAAGLGEADPHADRDLLLKAYRDGARALGETVSEAAWEAVGAPDGHRGRGGYTASGWRWHGND